MKVNNIIIGEQYESTENYEKIKRLAEKNKINVTIIKSGERVNIEKDMYIDFLWPNSNKVITQNIVNNNSLVFRMKYKNFSMMFTGDIEEIAEKEICKKYKNLQSTILKIAHHGSKTSSTEKFLDLVNPNYALIGVGKNNKFGHPNKNIIERLRKRSIDFYRTDQNGEIKIETNGKTCIKITTFDNNIKSGRL